MMIGESLPLRELLVELRRFACCDIPVLIDYERQSLVSLASSMRLTLQHFLQDVEFRPGTNGVSNSGQHGCT